MHWELWDRRSANLIEEFDSEEEALQGVRDMLAVNRPDLLDEISVGAMYDEGEPHDVALPPALYGDPLRARLAAMAQEGASEAAHKIHAQIRIWLAEEGWDVLDIEDPQSVFNVMVKLEGGASVNIFQYKDHLDHITFSQHCVFDEESQQEVMHLPIAAQKGAVYRIHRDIAMMGLNLTGLAFPPREMTIRTYAYFDGLSKDVFVQRALLTMHAVKLALLTFGEALDVADSVPESQTVDQSSDHADDAQMDYVGVTEKGDRSSSPPANVVSLRPRTMFSAGSAHSRTAAS